MANNPKSILNEDEYGNYRSMRASAVLYILLGTLLLVGMGATVASGDMQKDDAVGNTITVFLLIAGICGVVGGLAVLLRKLGLVPLMYIMAAIYIIGFPIGTILSIFVFRGLKKYVGIIKKLDAAGM